MTDPALIRQTGGLDKSDFSSPYLAGIYEMIINRYGDGQNISLASVASELDSDGASRLTLIMQKPEDMAERSKAMADYIEKIKTEKLKESSKDDLLAVREKLREKKGYGG